MKGAYDVPGHGSCSLDFLIALDELIKVVSVWREYRSITTMYRNPDCWTDATQMGHRQAGYQYDCCFFLDFLSTRQARPALSASAKSIVGRARFNNAVGPT